MYSIVSHGYLTRMNFRPVHSLAMTFQNKFLCSFGLHNRKYQVKKGKYTCSNKQESGLCVSLFFIIQTFPHDNATFAVPIVG